MSPVKIVTLTAGGKSVRVGLVLDRDLYHGQIEIAGVALRLTAARVQFFRFWRFEEDPDYCPMQVDGWTFIAIPFHQDQ